MLQLVCRTESAPGRPIPPASTSFEGGGERVGGGGLLTRLGAGDGGGGERRGGGRGGCGGGFGGGGGGQMAPTPSQIAHSLQRSSVRQWCGLQKGSQMRGLWRICEAVVLAPLLLELLPPRLPLLLVTQMAHFAHRTSASSQCFALHQFGHCAPGTPATAIDAAAAALVPSSSGSESSGSEGVGDGGAAT